MLCVCIPDSQGQVSSNKLSFRFYFIIEGGYVWCVLCVFVFVCLHIVLQMYCTICSGGEEVFMCDAENCAK